jgi:hypothetical protein
MWLLIGKDGQLGGALFKHFKNCTGTSRHTGARPYFQLTDDPSSLPASEVVFIVAAKTKFRDCEIDEDAWSINDSRIRSSSIYLRKLPSGRGTPPTGIRKDLLKWACEPWFRMKDSLLSGRIK